MIQPYSETDTHSATAIELASTPVVAIRADLDAINALGQMYRHGVHHLAVVSDEEDIALVSAADLLMGIAGRTLGESVPVVTLCRRPAPSVDAHDAGSAAARVMTDAHTDALLVFGGGDVHGVLTAMDLVRGLANVAVSTPAGGD